MYWDKDMGQIKILILLNLIRNMNDPWIIEVEIAWIYPTAKN